MKLGTIIAIMARRPYVGIMLTGSLCASEMMQGLGPASTSLLTKYAGEPPGCQACGAQMARAAATSPTNPASGSTDGPSAPGAADPAAAATKTAAPAANTP